LSCPVKVELGKAQLPVILQFPCEKKFKTAFSTMRYTTQCTETSGVEDKMAAGSGEKTILP
jgi:hypothetical protein